VLYIHGRDIHIVRSAHVKRTNLKEKDLSL